MIELTRYKSFDDQTTGKVLVARREIAAVEPYQYHSFRPAISQITLQSGKRLQVWETVDEVGRKIRDTTNE